MGMKWPLQPPLQLSPGAMESKRQKLRELFLHLCFSPSVPWFGWLDFLKMTPFLVEKVFLGKRNGYKSSLSSCAFISRFPAGLTIFMDQVSSFPTDLSIIFD